MELLTEQEIDEVGGGNMLLLGVVVVAIAVAVGVGAVIGYHDAASAENGKK